MVSIPNQSDFNKDFVLMHGYQVEVLSKFPYRIGLILTLGWLDA